MWETFYSRYVVEKNRHLNTQFFQNINNIQGFQTINYNYFKRLLDEDASLSNLNLVGIAIYDVHKEFIWSHRLSPYNISNSIKDADVYEIIKDKLVLNEVSTAVQKKDKKTYKLICAPLKSQSFIHNASIVYIFDIDNLLTGSDLFKRLVILSIILYIVFFISIFSMSRLMNMNIKILERYIETNKLGKQKTTKHNLQNVKPFNILSKKITQLIALVKEYEARYIDSAQKLFEYSNISNEGWVSIDKNGMIFFCNKRFAEILEYENEEELYNTRFETLFYSEFEINKYREKNETVKQNVKFIKKLFFQTKNGYKRECKLNESCIFGNDGNVSGYYYCISDITDMYSANTKEKLDIMKIRTAHFDQTEQPLVVLNADNVIIDTNYAFLNYVQKERTLLVSKSFKDIIYDFEAGKAWQENANDFEIFEPSLMKWYYISKRKLELEETTYQIISFLDIHSFKKEYYFQKLILEDIKGFYFVTNKADQVIYLSQSFTNITENSEAWFKNYYALMLLSKDKTIDIHKHMIITYRKNKFEFMVTQLFTSIDSLNLYQAILK